MPADVFKFAGVSVSRPQSAASSYAEGHAEPAVNGHSIQQQDDWPADWPDSDLTSNDSFLSFVEFAVREALRPYRSGHSGVQVCFLFVSEFGAHINLFCVECCCQ